MQIEYSKQAAKFISTQDKNTKLRIKRGIEGLTETPPKGDIKPLQGYTNKTYRLRIGKLRIIYRYDICVNQPQILFISDINSRGDIY
jgi:mRNA interferase RelE/StbE